MGFVEDNLTPGENVMYRTTMHWIIFLQPVIVVLMAFIVLVGAAAYHIPALAILGGLLLLLAALGFISPLIHYTSSEFAVTDKRVLIKVGLISRRSLELLLTKVEGIGVDQSILGRMLGYGTITVTGTGGTREAFQNINSPLEFRRQVESHVP